MAKSISITAIFVESLKDYFKLIPEMIKYLPIIFLPLGLLNQFFMNLAGNADDMTRIYASLFSMTISLIAYFLMVLMVPYLYHNPDSEKRNMGEHIRNQTSPLTIESLRALGQIAVGLLLFIIPGIIRMIKYAFIPFIVQFHPQYLKGSADALKLSRELCKGVLFKITIILVLLQVFVILTEYAVMKWNIYQAPVQWFVAFAAQFSIEVLTVVIMYKTYQHLTARREQNGITV